MTLSDSTEQAFLGCLIRAPEIIKTVDLIISGDYFSTVKSQKLYSIIKSWHDFYEDVSRISTTEFHTFVESQYTEWYKRNQVYIGECLKFIPSEDVASEKWEMHFNSLEKFVQYRKFKELIYDVDKKIDEDPLNIGSHIQNTMTELSSNFSITKDFQNKNLLGSVIENFQIELHKRSDPEFTPSYFDLKELDNLMGVFFPSTYNLITARSSVGKSAFVNTIIRNMVYKQDKKIAVFNLETGNFSFLMRWFAKDLKIDSRLIRDPKQMTAEQRLSVLEASKKLFDNYDQKLFLFENIYYVDKIIQKILFLDKAYGLDGIVIDLLEYVRSGEKSQNRTQEIAYISNELFNLTRGNRFWVSMIQQQNKEGDKKGEQSSGRNAEDPFMQADTVMGLYHVELDNGEKDLNRRLVKITKGRDSGTGNVNLKYIGKYTLFEDEVIDGDLDAIKTY